MSPVVLFLVVAMAGVTSGIVWTALDAVAHRGPRAQTADALAAMADTLGRIEEHTRQTSHAVGDVLTVLGPVEADVRALRDAVDGMVGR